MNDSHLKRLALLIALGLAILAASLYLIARPTPPAPVPAAPPVGPAATSSPGQAGSTSSTQPKITWSHNQVGVVLSPGESTSNDLTFSSSLDLQNIVVEAVPEIRSFLTIEPNSLTSVPAGLPQSVHLSFLIPNGTALATYEGTIHVQVGSTTLPQTLKIAIETGKSFLTSTYSIMYPADWSFSQTGPNQVSFIPPGKQTDLAREYVGDIVIETTAKSATIGLQDFYKNSAVVNLFENSQAQTSFVVNGFPAVKFTGVFGMVPTDIVAVDKGMTVVEVSDVGQLHESDGILDLMVNSIH